MLLFGIYEGIIMKWGRETIVEDADSDAEAEAERNLILYDIKRLSHVYVLYMVRSFIASFPLKKEGKSILI